MKLSNWTIKLVQTIEAAKQRPFSWGKFDCCVFAAECVKAQTGVDHLSEFRGRYSTKLGAHRLLKSHGGIEAILDKKFKRVKCDTQISRGDLVLFNSPDGVTLGVMFNAVWAPTNNGVAAVNCEILASWSIE